VEWWALAGSGITARAALAEGLVAVWKAAGSTELQPWKTRGIYGMAEEQWERTET